MKKFLNTSNLPLITLICGAVGFLLRIWLLSTGFDEKGLIVSGHPAIWLLWLLCIAMIVILVLGTSRLLEAPKYRFNFPASLPGGIGTALAAAGILICTLVEAFAGPDFFGIAVCVAGAITVPTLCWIGYCRWKGIHPSPVFHVAASVYLLLRLVWMYRQWSSDPQLQDYVFQLLALICLMLACYNRSAFDANMGNRRFYAIFSLGAVFCCLVSLPGCDSAVFFLSAGVWMLTNLCSLMPMKKYPREEK